MSLHEIKDGVTVEKKKTQKKQQKKQKRQNNENTEYFKRIKYMNSKNLTIKLRILSVIIAAVCLCAFIFVACNDEDKGGGKAKHDSSQPVVVTSFMPDSGRIMEMVILDGSNFGSDTSKIKVFFNEKAAKVLGSTGDAILVLVPRLPGDTCVLTVEVDEQKAIAPKFFYYKIEANASTFAGNGNTDLNTSSLDQSQLRPIAIYADDEYNLFVGTDDGYLVRLNEKENTITVLATSAHGMMGHLQIDVDPKTGMLMMGGAGSGNRDRFLFLDPKLGWAPKSYYIKEWILEPNASPPDADNHYHCLYCKADGYYYTIYYPEGSIVRINPDTWKAQRIYRAVENYWYGMAFHPKRPTELWLAADNGCLYKLDVTSPTSTFRKLNIGAGFRDGRLDQAQFSGIRHIRFDEDGNLFVGDNNNHCIRKVDTQTNKVETVIGIPQAAGFKDGKKEDAQFRNPHGIAVDPDGVIYVADWGNSRVRRVAVE
jgi:hypothetical protein